MFCEHDKKRRRFTMDPYQASGPPHQSDSTSPGLATNISATPASSSSRVVAQDDTVTSMHLFPVEGEALTGNLDKHIAVETLSRMLEFIRTTLLAKEREHKNLPADGEGVMEKWNLIVTKEATPKGSGFGQRKKVRYSAPPSATGLMSEQSPSSEVVLKLVPVME